MTDPVYERVVSGALGIEFHVGRHDRMRLGVHVSDGRFDSQSGGLESNGVEAGYLTHLGRLHSLGFF